MSSKGVSVLRLALAVVMPLFIVANSLYALEGLRSHADERADRNAGKVINGRVLEGSVATAIDAALEEAPPQVIILGNSLSNTNIEPVLLARKLGIKAKFVHRFSIPNSIGAHWYAILKNRVYANGHSPKLVILYSDLQSALAITPRSESSMQNLRVHLTKNEPTIDRKLGARNYFFERVKENRSRLRNRALTEARNTVVDLLWHHSLTPTDDRETEAALSRVFDDSKTNMQLHNNVIPAFDQGSGWKNPFDPEDLPKPKDSFIPEIARMVNKNGGKAIFIRPPMSPALADGLGDLVPEESEKKVPRIASRNDGFSLDMRELPMDIHHFRNVDHMNDEGERRHTLVLAEIFRSLRVVKRNRRRVQSFVPEFQLINNVVVPTKPTVHYNSRPPKLPQPVRQMGRARSRLTAMKVDDLKELSDLRMLDFTPHASRCSPVRVLDNGVPLPKPNVGCDEASRYKHGRMCQTNERIFFSTVDGSSPFTNGHTYTIALDPDRTCNGALWVYPGDVATVTMGDISEWNNGANTLVVKGHTAGDFSSGLTVRLKLNGQTILNQHLTKAQLEVGIKTSLDPALSPTDKIELVVTNNSNGYALLGDLLLVEAAP